MDVRSIEMGGEEDGADGVRVAGMHPYELSNAVPDAPMPTMPADYGAGSTEAQAADAERRRHRDNAFRARTYNCADGFYWGSPGTADALAPAFYMPMIRPNMGPTMRRMKISTDKLLRLPDPTCDMLLKEFVDFWGAAECMAQRELSMKRGILLYGPPGSGKTTALQLMSQHMIDTMRGVVVMANEPETTAACLALVRQVEPARPIICLYEDLDAMVDRYGEPGLLALLDGELQIANVVNVATTNYPEYLDPRFVDRPGRFDRIAYVGMPLAEARRAYFQAKAPELEAERIDRWVEASEGWSMAHLRELVVAHLALGEPEEAVIERLTDMREDRPKSDKHPGRAFGFGAAPEENRNAVRALARGALAGGDRRR